MSLGPSIRFDIAAEKATFAQVVKLGDRNKKTLGFLPYAGFRTAATNDRIAVARTDDGRVLGYCLFDLPRDVVRIVQLCVTDEARGTRLARALVDEVSERHSDRLGLVLKCRSDWPADKMWPKLGFAAQTQVRGRSKQQHPLTVWWRSHAHADLFTLLEEHRTGRAAAIDSNVYCDLHSARLRQGADQTAALAPLIADEELSLVLVPSLEAEVYATPDSSERTRFLHAKLNYSQATNTFSQSVVDRLLAGIPERARSKDDSLYNDAILLAEAHANNIDLFITRDEGVLEHLTEPAAELGIDILRPTEVSTYLDAAQADHTYQPAQLMETAFTVQRLDRGLASHEVNCLLDKAGGERLTELRQLLADLAGRSTKDVERRTLFDGDARLRAAWATHGAKALEVPLLRVTDGNLQQTIAAQLSQILRADAVVQGKTAIHVTDPHIDKTIRRILEADGFYTDVHGLVALSLPIVATWADVAAAVRASTVEHELDPLSPLSSLPEHPSLTQVVEFERLLTPAKILGQGIPNFLIPIRRQFASQLLGYPASLMGRPDDLGLSREHVYYSSRRGTVKSPARILWYVSGQTDPSVIASSNLVEVRVDTPRRLHRLYARLGVWSQSDVERAAPSGRAAALRFTNTEMFHKPVGLDLLRTLTTDGQNLVLRSAGKLDDESYERIYREGVQR